MGMKYTNEASFKEKIDRLIRMYQRGWVNENDYHSRQVAILKDVEGMADYVLRTRLYMVARDSQFITVKEFEEKKQALIDEIFAPYASMDEFQEKVGMLLKLKDLQKKLLMQHLHRVVLIQLRLQSLRQHTIQQ